MRLKIIINMSILLLFLSLATQVLYAEGKGGDNNSLNKTLGLPTVTKFNINNISTFIYADGRADVTGSNPGYTYPILSGKTANFQSGFLWGGYVGNPTDNKLRVGGSVYRTSLTVGKINSNGLVDDPNGTDVRIYRVRRDYKTGSLATEVLDEGRSEADVKSQYEKDWNSWPWQWGAPFEDVGKLGADGKPVLDAQGNNVKDGVYDPLIDIPGVPGADQTIWFVSNDLSQNQASKFYGTVPMGIEVQVTVWGYKQAGALGNMLFKKYVMINKNSEHKDFNKFYVSYWSDTDIGGGAADYSGCDTLKSLFYTFSAIPSNSQYGTTPPSTGFDFFQGPKFKTNVPQDTAIFNGKYIVGWKNLPMSAHYFFINGDATFGDPDQNNAIGTSQWYNLFEGKVASSGIPFYDPVEKKNTKFALAGDPFTKTGWVDGILHQPGDRRNGGVSGPFTLAYGDTQEVVIAQMSAGATAGVDNYASLKLLFDYDATAQIAYNRLFKLPQAAPAPKLTVTPYDKKLLLNWGSDPAAVNATESYDVFGYKFQGYKVYQLPKNSASVSEGILLGTFDIIDGITSIIDKTTDSKSGAIIDFVAANGGDTGVRRTLEITDDKIIGSGTPLRNGSKYYFAVTSYSYNPNPPFGAKVLDNPLAIITATPETLKPGVILNSKSGDPITVKRTGGVSDGKVVVSVVDPLKVTGETYNVIFKDDGQGGVLWTLKKGSTEIFKNRSNISGENQYFDGLQMAVTGPPNGVKVGDAGWSIPNGTRRFTWAGGADAFQLEGFNGAVGYTSPRAIFGDGVMKVGPGELKNVVLKLAKVNFTGDYAPPFDLTDPNVSYGYRFLRRNTSAPAKPEFAPFIINKTGGYAFQAFEKNVPLSAWNVDDPAQPKRLAIAFLENNVAGGLVDGKYWPGNHNNYDNISSSGPREWLFILDTPYSETQDPVIASEIIGSEARVMYFITWARRGAAPFSPTTSGEDAFAIYGNKAITSTDAFSFTSPTVGYDADLAKADVDNVNVFPNPYYGVNPQELTKYNRWVTFTHLPAKATIRIYNLAGQLVRTIIKDDASSQFQRWDLQNENNLPVGSGLFIAHIDMPDLGKTKILKVAIIQEKQILDIF